MTENQVPEESELIGTDSSVENTRPTAEPDVAESFASRNTNKKSVSSSTTSGWSTTKRVTVARSAALVLGAVLGVCGCTKVETDEATQPELQQDPSDQTEEVATCAQDGGDWDIDLGSCTFTAQPDINADTESEPILDPEPEPEPDNDELCVGGGTFDASTGTCTFVPQQHHAVFGMQPPGAALQDPPAGQSGSNDEIWATTDAVDIETWSAWRTEITGAPFDQFFNTASFPCGAATETYRVHCPVGAAELAPGEFVMVAMTLAGPIETGGALLQYGLAFDSGGDENYVGRAPFELDLFNDTELWYRLEIAADGTRHMYADGFQNGAPNFPRHSSALAIEFTDRVVWLVPTRELAAAQPVNGLINALVANRADRIDYRVTSFRNEGSQLEPPNENTSGGDVSGLDVSELSTVPSEVVVAKLGPDTPPDVPGGQTRLPAPTDDGQTLLIAELTANLEQRWNAAFATGDVDPVVAVLHPVSVLASPDGCRSFVERIFPGAQQIELVWVPAEPTVAGGIVGYVADAAVTYPTGTTQFPISIAVGQSGQLAPVFDCQT